MVEANGGETGRPGTGAGPRRSRKAFWLVAAGLIAALAAGLGGWYGYQADRAARREKAISRLICDRNYSDALAEADRWVRESPRSAMAYFQKARAEVGLTRPEDALRSADQARKLGMDLPRLERILGLLYARGGREAEATAILARSAELDTEPDCQVEESLTDLYRASTQLGKAYASAERWRDAAPNDPRPYYWMGKIDQEISSAPQVREASYQNAIKCDPSFLPARYALAAVLSEKGDYSAALAEYLAILDRAGPSSEAYAGAGWCQLELGSLDEARDLFDQALAIEPDLILAQSGQAMLDQRLGQFEAARDLLRELVKRSPRDASLHFQLASALERMHQSEEASQERATTNRLRQEDKDLAVLLREVIQDPSNPERNADVIVYLFDHGRDDEAVKSAEAFLKRNGRHRRVEACLAEYYEKHGNVGLANYYRARAGSER